MSDIRSLAQRHDNAVAVMKESAKDMQVEGLSEVRLKELQDKFDAAEKEEKSLNEILVRAKAAERFAKKAVEDALLDEEVREAQVSARGRRGGPTDAEKREQVNIFLHAMQHGVADLTKEERAMLGNKVEVRGTSTQVVGTAGLGGYLVPVLLQNEIIKLAKDYSGIMQVGRVRYTSTGGQITFPSRNTTGRKAVKTAESGSIAKQDITYTQVVMDSYKYTDKLGVSWELLQDSEFDIEAEFMDAFGESFGRAMNETLTVGDGSGDPNGVVTASTLGVTAASATAITLGEVIDLEYSVDPAYRRVPTCGYMLNDKLLSVIKKLSLAATNDFAGTWQPSFRDGAPSMINGYPYWINQDMDSTVDAESKILLFGDFNKYNIRIAKDMVIMKNEYSSMDNGEVNFVGFARWDGELFDTTAVKHLITAAS